ncbi:MAG TPA: ATP-binding protein [Dehalococcoidia bacterium]|nr:ATP-binding protein [Dehalococcoidia bacterium]
MEQRHVETGVNPDSAGDAVQALPEAVLESIDQQVEQAGGEWREPPEYEGSVGRTMFDTPASADGTVTVLLPRENIGALPSQSLVRIKSVGDGRSYLGAVVKGPFAEPDGLRADAPIVVTATVRGGIFMPKYHGRLQVELIGEELEDGGVVPPRRRPLPNSPVFVLTPDETASVLRIGGDIRLGLADGQEDIEVTVPSASKSVLPRHTGILGTTGAGKSTTVSGLVAQLQKAGVASIVLDTEGEYTAILEPTDDQQMQRALSRRGMHAGGVDNTHLYHLVGRETANPQHPSLHPFSLRFSDLSPYAVMEILDLNDAQQERFLKAYDAAKAALDRLKIYPATDDERNELMDLDELEAGYPRMTLTHVHDVVKIIASQVAKEEEPPYLETREFHENRDVLKQAIAQSPVPGHIGSWRALQGRLGRIKRLGIFDNPRVAPLDYAAMLQPGRVSIIDLSDTDSPQVNNLVIAQILRGVQRQQDENYQRAVKANRQPTPALVFIEEAHEFLSAQRIKDMPVLFQQVARIARRGRKRWLGLVFITQLPQHLPDEVIGLINNWILHKINDSNVVSRLRRSIGDIDAALWDRLPNLAPGQAIVSFTSLARPLLVAIDPAPCKLQMVE